MKLDVIDVTHVKPAGLHGTPIPQEFVPGLVSVVLPTYNRALFLPEAMNSVWAQTYRPVELLVVDDGSSDNTAEVVQRTVASWPDDPAFRVVYVLQPNRGASAARNQGLLHSRGEFIQYLDSDDVLVRHKLATHVHVLQADESLDVVWSAWEVAPSDELAERLAGANQQETMPDHAAWEATDKTICWEPWPTLTRRRFIVQHPLWNERTSRWDDWEYALRLMAAHPKRAFAPGMFCIQREHEHGRRHDFDYDPAGIAKGLVAVREAGKARDQATEASPELDQRVAERYWELFIEGIHHGSSANALEALKGASAYARRKLFHTKASLMQIFLRLAGTTVTRAILRGRYFPD